MPLPSDTYFLHDWLGFHASRTPVKTALIDAGPDSAERISWGGWHGRVEGLYGWLERQGLQPQDRVAFFGVNSIPFLTVYLACSRGGFTFVPLNFRWAPDEVAFALEDFRPKLVFADRPFVESVSKAAGSIPVYPADDRYVEPCAAGPVIDPESVAGLFYTSGTTGRPKAAVCSHRRIWWNTRNAAERFEMSSSDVALLATPLFHTGALFTQFQPLLASGGTAVLLSQFTPESYLETITRHGVTITFAVPTIMEQLLRSGALDRNPPRGLRFLYVAGAAATAPLVEAYESRGIPLRQGYGTTETNMISCMQHGEVKDRPASVGRIVPNWELKILDDGGGEAAPGGTGEIAVKGPGMFSGYLNRPEETAQAIRDGYFHTGDLGRLDADGFLYIVGRKKEMYISGGENVYPAEVERVLSEHPSVAEVAVTGIPDPKWGESGAALIVLRDGYTLDTESLRCFARERLAHYKVPARWKSIDALPRNALGKVVKSAVSSCF